MEVRHGPCHTPAVHLHSLGYRTDLALLRWGGSQIVDRGDHLVVRSPHNPTHWWGNFLLLDAVPPAGDADHWLETFAAEFPGAAHVALGFDGVDGTVADLAAFTERGCTAEAQTVMTASEVRPPARSHPGAVNRPLVDDDDWAQSIALRLSCHAAEPAYDRAFVAAKVATQRALVEAGHGGWFGAFVDGRLVCQMGLFRIGDGIARFQSVETDPTFRRRGLAGALVHHVSRYGFDRLGARTLVMVADPDYVAIDLYRAVGFRDTEAQCQVERTH